MQCAKLHTGRVKYGLHRKRRGNKHLGWKETVGSAYNSILALFHKQAFLLSGPHTERPPSFINWDAYPLMHRYEQSARQAGSCSSLTLAIADWCIPHLLPISSLPCSTPLPSLLLWLDSCPWVPSVLLSPSQRRTFSCLQCTHTCALTHRHACAHTHALLPINYLPPLFWILHFPLSALQPADTCSLLSHHSPPTP